jgi:hypothetical protein
MAFHLPSQDALLQLVTMLEEFLNDIVAENVRHQLERILSNLRKDNLLLVAVGRFELLLDEA